MSVPAPVIPVIPAVLDVLADVGFLPVVVLDDARRAAALAEALVESGCAVVEVVLRTPQALDGLRRMVAQAGLRVAAGTVTSPEQVEAVAEAGAELVVTPGWAPVVVDACLRRDLAVLPGIGSATDLLAATSTGLSVVKLFPADLLGGPAMVRALAGPFPGVQFVPSGGVDETTAPAYVAMPEVAAISGSWVTPRDVVARGEMGAVRDRARAVLRLVAEARAAR